MLRAFCVSVGCLVVAGCGGGGGDARGAGEVAAQYQGEIRSSDVARGEQVFQNVCNSCHAAGAPNLTGIGWEPGRMRQQVREGSGRMPAIGEGRLSADDLEAVLAYLTTTGGVQGALPASAGGEAPEEPAAEEPAADVAE